MAVSFGVFCAEPQSACEKKPLSLGQNIVIGGLAGAAEVAFPGQSLTFAMNLSLKNAQQAVLKPEFKKERFKLASSYQGFAANALGQMPITAMQNGVKAYGSELLKSAQQDRPLSDAQNAGISFSAGVAGALIDTPSNAVQLFLQDKTRNAGKSTLQACRELGAKSFRGFMPNAFFKEGPFTLGYQMLSPKGKQIARDYVGDTFIATALGGSATGVFIAVVTQPGAVLRHAMQSDFSSEQSLSTWQTARKICREHGYKGLFTGLPQRGVRVALAIQLYGFYITTLEGCMA